MLKKFKNNKMAMEALKMGVMFGVVIAIMLHIPAAVGDKLMEFEVAMRQKIFKK